MSRSSFKIPLNAKAQSFFMRLSGTLYWLTFRWNSASACWMLSVANEAKVPMLSSVPAVTGLDLLAPYRHLGIKGSLIVQTDHNADAVPTFANLGTDGNVYYVVGTP